jgi:hypothetical protein
VVNLTKEEPARIIYQTQDEFFAGLWERRDNPSLSRGKNVEYRIISNEDVIGYNTVNESKEQTMPRSPRYGFTRTNPDTLKLDDTVNLVGLGSYYAGYSYGRRSGSQTYHTGQDPQSARARAATQGINVSELYLVGVIAYKADATGKIRSMVSSDNVITPLADAPIGGAETTNVDALVNTDKANPLSANYPFYDIKVSVRDLDEFYIVEYQLSSGVFSRIFYSIDGAREFCSTFNRSIPTRVFMVPLDRFEDITPVDEMLGI